MQTVPATTVAQHTPGPWAAHRWPGTLEHVIYGSHMTLITRVSLYGDDDTAGANARLIAAAPDGLEAARFALSVLKANPVEASERLAIEKLETFIAKATEP